MLPPYINAAEEHQAENAGVYYRRPDQGIGHLHKGKYRVRRDGKSQQKEVSGPVDFGDGNLSLFVRDPDRIVIELRERRNETLPMDRRAGSGESPAHDL